MHETIVPSPEDEKQIQKATEIAYQIGILILVHAEIRNLIKKNAINQESPVREISVTAKTDMVFLMISATV